MKKYILMLILITLSVSSCQVLDQFTQFNMEFNETFVIPSTFGINLPFNILTPDIETNSESTFAVNDTRKDLIEEIQLKTITLTLTSPSNADFSFLKSISVFIVSENYPEIEVAWKNDISNDIGAIISLQTTDKDLKDYIKEDNFDLRIKTVTDEIPMADHQIDLYSVFFVDAKILGQ